MSRNFWLPLPILLVVLGFVVRVALGSNPALALDPQVLAYFLPALLFEAAWDFEVSLPRSALFAIGLLAVPGTLLTMGIVAWGTTLTGHLAWGSALVLGAIVAATDPVGVLALFRRLGLPHVLTAIVEGESVLNDGVAVVLTQTLTVFALGGAAFPGIAGVAARMLIVSFGGIGVGAIAGALCAAALRAARAGKNSRVGIAVTVLMAYGSYLSADALGFSGIFAVVTAGLCAPLLTGFSPGEEAFGRVERFWDAAAFVANGAVFFLVGINAHLDGIARAPLVPAVALLAVFFARAFLSYGVLPLAGLTRLPLSWRHAIALAGLRGGLSLALALGLPTMMPGRETIVNAVAAVVFVTLVVQGALIAPLAGAFTTRR